MAMHTKHGYRHLSTMSQTRLINSKHVIFLADRRQTRRIDWNHGRIRRCRAHAEQRSPAAGEALPPADTVHARRSTVDSGIRSAIDRLRAHSDRRFAPEITSGNNAGFSQHEAATVAVRLDGRGDRPSIISSLLLFIIVRSSSDGDHGHGLYQSRCQDRRECATRSRRDQRISSCQTSSSRKVSLHRWPLNAYDRPSSSRTIRPLLIDHVYTDRKNEVIKAERRLLKELGFCVYVKHPHKVTDASSNERFLIIVLRFSPS